MIKAAFVHWQLNVDNDHALMIRFKSIKIFLNLIWFNLILFYSRPWNVAASVCRVRRGHPWPVHPEVNIISTNVAETARFIYRLLKLKLKFIFVTLSFFLRRVSPDLSWHAACLKVQHHPTLTPNIKTTQLLQAKSVPPDHLDFKLKK